MTDKEIIESLKPLDSDILERAYSILDSYSIQELKNLIDMRTEYIDTGLYDPLMPNRVAEMETSFKLAYYEYKKINFSELMSFKKWLIDNFGF